MTMTIMMKTDRFKIESRDKTPHSEINLTCHINNVYILHAYNESLFV